MKYVATASMEKWSYGGVKRILSRLDVKHAVIGEEIGKLGYRHLQMAIDCSGDLESYASNNSLGWHIEMQRSWNDQIFYCRKGNNVHELGDLVELKEYYRIARRPPTYYQRAIESSLDHQNDRSVTVWVDPIGRKGKSTACYLLCRRGQALLVPRTEIQPKKITDFIGMHYDNHKIIWIDVPRKKRLLPEIAEALEEIKDGQIQTSKYEGSVTFLKGAKILVTTNQPIWNDTYEALTEDRWDIWPRNHGRVDKWPEKGRTKGNTSSTPSVRRSRRTNKRQAPKGGAPLPPRRGDCSAHTVSDHFGRSIDHIHR